MFMCFIRGASGLRVFYLNQTFNWPIGYPSLLEVKLADIYTSLLDLMAGNLGLSEVQKSWWLLIFIRGTTGRIIIYF